MAKREGDTDLETCNVTDTRNRVREALQRLEEKSRKRWRPWADLKQETDKALGAKVLGRIDDHLFWLERRGYSLENPADKEINRSAAAVLESLLPSVVTAVRCTDLNEQLLWSLERDLRNVYDQVAPDEYISAAIKKEAASTDQGSGDYAEELQRAKSSDVDLSAKTLSSRDLLVLRKQAKDNHYRHERATAARRRELLWLSALLLWLLVPHSRW